MSADNPLTEALGQMAESAMDKAMSGIAASLAKIAGKATDPKMTAFEGLLNEISAALSDVVAGMEKPDGDAAIAKAITDGLKALRIEVAAPTVNVKAPEVSVNVNPTPIQNNVHVDAPQVHVMERPGATFTVDIDYHSGGLPRSMTITRT